MRCRVQKDFEWRFRLPPASNSVYFFPSVFLWWWWWRVCRNQIWKNSPKILTIIDRHFLYFDHTLVTRSSKSKDFFYLVRAQVLSLFCYSQVFLNYWKIMLHLLLSAFFHGQNNKFLFKKNSDGVSLNNLNCKLNSHNFTHNLVDIDTVRRNPFWRREVLAQDNSANNVSSWHSTQTMIYFV